MTRYFDKTFFKFLFGFIAIVAVSLAVIILTNLYTLGTNSQPLQASPEAPSHN